MGFFCNAALCGLHAPGTGSFKRTPVCVVVTVVKAEELVQGRATPNMDCICLGLAFSYGRRCALLLLWW
jgi:hypothetical protein